MPVSITVLDGLCYLPDDVLQVLATFVPLSDLLVLVHCSRHIRMVLQKQLNRCLDRLFAVSHLEEYWARARHMPCIWMYLREQPEQRILEGLFGEVDQCGDWSGFCFIDGQNILGLTKDKVFFDESDDGYALYYIVTGKETANRDSSASWLQRRCERAAACYRNTRARQQYGCNWRCHQRP
jgi:hypothetical protein